MKHVNSVALCQHSLKLAYLAQNQSSSLPAIGRFATVAAGVGDRLGNVS